MQNKYERQRIVYCTYGVLALGIFLGSLVLLIAAILPTTVLDYGLEEYGIEAMVNLPVKEMMIIRSPFPRDCIILHWEVIMELL